MIMVISEKQVQQLMSMVQSYIYLCKHAGWFDVAGDANNLLATIRSQQSEELKEIK